ncbi:hypothetical protein LshimejAT787_0500620 [Lyophyllum shimeji]|uniref:Nephrocystin 3-like N-terminal domain-containing protein n=1 Tax=Lyophyllum shimeji TaxID=47721 RepID=A0A9P3PKX5_LYOSH|nr:hypothetical protein LshimejAT787_0500620 [Lyophyllum shimeji]
MSLFTGAQNTTIHGTPYLTSIGGDQNNYRAGTLTINNVQNIGGSTVTSSGREGRTALCRAGTPHAAFNSAARHPPPCCHPDTRKDLLGTIAAWHAAVRDGTTWDQITPKDRPGLPEQRPARILWLYGPAGAGKSAIAQTVAEICHEQKSLAASFFFTHGQHQHVAAHQFFPTIAHDISAHGLGLQDVGVRIGRAVENDFQVFKKNFSTQARTWLLEPLRDANTSSTGGDHAKACLVVIDGLDECIGLDAILDQQGAMGSSVQKDATLSAQDTQELLISSIMELFDEGGGGYADLPLSFLIVSRPEPHISKTFAQQPQAHHSLAVGQTRQADLDVKDFLQSEFDRIRKSYEQSGWTFPDRWPTESDLQLLVMRSGGYFIYPKTVLNFIAAHVDGDIDKDVGEDADKDVDEEYFSPLTRLRRVVRGVSADVGKNPFSNLDILYQRILSGSLRRPVNRVDLLRILGYILAQPPSQSRDIVLTPLVIAAVLNLTVQKVLPVLQRLHSILRIGSGATSPGSLPGTLQPQSPIEGLHVSFADFLSDPKRAGEFSLDSQQIHSDIARGCLEYLKETVHRTDIAPQGSELVFRHFIFRSWTFHFGQAGDTAKAVEVLRQMDRELWNKIIDRWARPGSQWECIDMLDEAVFESNFKLTRSENTIFYTFCELRNVQYREHLGTLAVQYLASEWPDVVKHISVLFDVSCFLLTLHEDGALARLLGLRRSSDSSITTSGWSDIRRYATHIHRQIQRYSQIPEGIRTPYYGLKGLMSDEDKWDRGSPLYPDNHACHAHLAVRCFVTLMSFQIEPGNGRRDRTEWFYAMKHWPGHLFNSTSGNQKLLQLLRSSDLPGLREAVSYSFTFENFVSEIEKSQNHLPDSVIKWDSTPALSRLRFVLQGVSLPLYQFHTAQSTSQLREMFKAVDAANAATVIRWVKWPPSEKNQDILDRWKSATDQVNGANAVRMSAWDGAWSVSPPRIPANAARGVRTDVPRR